MGSRRVKKKKVVKQKYVTMDMFQNFIVPLGDVVEVVDKSLNKLEEDVDKLKKSDKAQSYINKFVGENVLDLGLRLIKLENLAKPIIFTETTKISEDIIKNLKNQPTPPITATPSTNTTPPLGSPESHCKHTLEAVQLALRKMNNIQYIVGQTAFIVRVKCQNLWRDITANFYNGYMMLTYYRRNGRYVEEKYTKNSMAAANMTAICMYYATR